MLGRLGKLVGSGALVFCGIAIAQVWPVATAQPVPGKPVADDKNVVAVVNGVSVTRQELAEELLARRGREQLQLLINRKIIEQAAQKAGITITESEIEQELLQFAEAANCTSIAEFDRQVLRQNKKTSLYEFKEDVAKPAILMRKLGNLKVTVTDEEIKQAFDARFGERVQCRIILEEDGRVARQTWSEIKGDPRIFIHKAREQKNQEYAAVGGRINPLGRSGGPYKKIEEELFKMKDGEISEVLQVPEGNVIVLREALLPPDPKAQLEDHRDTIRKELVERKLRVEVPKVFKDLREKAAVKDFLNQKFDVKEVLEKFNQPMEKSGG